MTDTSLAILLDRLMRRMQVGLHQSAPRFDPERIGPGGSMILLTLDELGQCPMHTLSSALCRDKSQMTRAVAALEKRGLVTKEPSTKDSRVTLIDLTDEGHDTVERVQTAIAQVLDSLLTPLAPSDKVELRRLLEDAVGTNASSA